MDKSGERLHMLQRNNQQLSSELARLRDENQKLDKSLADFRGKQVVYADTLAAVDRIWQQLGQDMAFLTRRIKGFPVDGAAPSIKVEAAELKNGDPFLRRLLTCDHPQAAVVQTRLDEIADDATEVEKALAPRAAGTQAAFAALIELHDSSVTAFRVAAAAVTPDGLGIEMTKLRHEAESLRREADAQKAVSRTAEAQLLQLTDMLKKDERVIQELNNELADKREEVSAVNRRLHTLRSLEGSSSLASQASLPAPLPSRNSLSPAPKSGEVDVGDELRLALKEIKVEKERADNLAKQLRDLQAKLQDESFVQQTGSYQVVHRQLLGQTAELDKARRTLEAMQREGDALRHNVQMLSQQAEDGRHQRRLVHLTEERMQELQHQVANARAAQEAAETALQQERQKFGHERTSEELKSMLDVLEREAAASRAKATRRQALVAEAQAAKDQARIATTGIEAKEAELRALKQKLQKAEAEIAALQEKERDLGAAVKDLQVFVEVLHTFCDDPRELVEVRASEAGLKNQLSLLQKQLKGNELQAALEKSKAAEAEATAQHTALEQVKVAVELEASGLRRQCQDLQQQVASLTSDIEAYDSEMETIGSAFEEMQGTNSRLLQQLAERDERAHQLMTERVQAQHAATRAAEQRAGSEAARKATEQQAVALHERLAGIEARMQELLSELGQARERATAAGQQAEKLAVELRDRDTQAAQREAQLAIAHGAAEQRKRQLDEEGERLSRDRSKRQRLEEENKVLQSKFEKLGSDPDSALREEIEGMRLLTRCRVCRVRSKDTVITKCWHTFCRDCVHRIIETRSRKCPACGTGFAQTEVKQIYL